VERRRGWFGLLRWVGVFMGISVKIELKLMRVSGDERVSD